MSDRKNPRIRSDRKISPRLETPNREADVFPKTGGSGHTHQDYTEVQYWIMARHIDEAAARAYALMVLARNATED